MEGNSNSEDDPRRQPGQGQYARSGGAYGSGFDRPSGAYRLPTPRHTPAPLQSSRTDGATSTPTGSHPTGGLQAGSHPTGSHPTGGFLPGGLQAGSHPTGSHPTGGFLPGGYPAGSPPTLADTPSWAPRGSEFPTRSERRSAIEERATPPKESVYLSRRPFISFLVALVMLVLMVPVVRLLVAVTVNAAPTPRNVVPAVLLTLGFTLSGIGLFSVARGGPISRESWLRPPVAYLPAGLLLLLAAGLAVA